MLNALIARFRPNAAQAHQRLLEAACALGVESALVMELAAAAHSHYGDGYWQLPHVRRLFVAETREYRSAERRLKRAKAQYARALAL
ncbi:hypothetical protein [Deinococcus multiflagellatus]|uniref:Uncharacterized protein n=1 Tax=Deinococcus multiflagellatus TaxID=1656887 RepID=A0ABW1ZTS0_9DEIO|nr:hypothetical protein [Deinococcus multiflagellatus]MBZ9714428.1 hypothetical protein [Deinococcus multiflagellatus]